MATSHKPQVDNCLGKKRIAKLLPPSTKRAIPRPRLFHLLQASVDRPLVWIEGPPGSGKTIAASQFIATRGGSAVWYRVDTDDADPQRFFTQLCLARPPILGNLPPLPVLVGIGQEEIAEFARQFFLAFFSDWGGDELLVLDGFQAAGSNEAFQTIVAVAAESIPTGSSILVTSRTPPPKNCTTLSSSDRTARIEWSQLSLTREEAVELAHSRSVTDLATVTRIHDLAEGWAKGLDLLLQDLQRIGTQTFDESSQDLQLTFNYLSNQLDDIFSAQEQLWLRTLAVPGRLSLNHARTLTGKTEAIELLERASGLNLLVYRSLPGSGHGNRESLYNFNRLFRRFLRENRPIPVSISASVHSLIAAASQMEAERYDEEAFELYVEAASWHDAVRVVSNVARESIRTGHHERLLQWLSRFPDPILQSNADLLLMRGLALVTSDPPGARQVLGSAFDTAVAQHMPLVAALAAAAVIDTYVLEHTELRHLDDWVQSLTHALYGEHVVYPDVDTELHVLGSALNVATFRMPTLPQRAYCVERIFVLAADAADPNMRANALTALMFHSVFTGRMPLGGRVRPMLEEAIHATNVSYRIRTLALYALAYHHVLDVLGEHTAVQECIKQLRAIFALHRLPQANAFADLIEYLYALQYGSRGEPARLACILERGSTLSGPLWDGIGAHARAWDAVFSGDPSGAVLHSRAIESSTFRQGSAYWAGAWSWPLIWGLRECGNIEEARKRAFVFDSFARATKIPALLSVADLMAFKWARDDDDEAAARLHVTSMIERVSAEGCHCLTWFPGWFEEAMNFALTRDISTRTVRHMARQVTGRHVHRSEIDEDLWPWRIRIRSFGGLAVLLDDVHVDYGVKAPHRLLSLIKALIALGPRPAGFDRISTILWPGDDRQTAESAIRVLVHRLRELLRDAAAVRVEFRTLWLDPERVWIDAHAFERSCQAARTGSPIAVRRALSLYSAPFLPQDSDEPWSLTRREHYRAQFEVLVDREANRLQAEKQYDAALRLLDDALMREELVESFHRSRMMCLMALGREAEAVAAYSRLRRLLWSRLSTLPSTMTERVFANAHQRQLSR